MRFALVNNKTYLAEKTRTNKRILEHQIQAARPSSITTTPKKD
jgi:hypothetical protein